MSTKLGRRPKYLTPKQHADAKVAYNKRYYEKTKIVLKANRDMMKIKEYTDDDIKNIIELVGWERILKLMIE